MKAPLAPTIVRFARLLRAAGLPIGVDKVLAALDAVTLVRPLAREDLYWSLAAVLATRAEHRTLFEAAFDLFWPERDAPSNGIEDPFAQPSDPAITEETLQGRLADALAREFSAEATSPSPARESRALEFVFSADEALKHMDFEKMSRGEAAAVERLLAKLRLVLTPVATRRFAPAHAGRRLNWRATLRAGLRNAGEIISLERHAPRRSAPPLTVLCDISASMESYTRTFLLFLHGLANAEHRLHVFVFGTRLTNITRALAHRDVDVALKQVSANVADWSGGTRIGPCLHEFNRRWSRRVLAQNAVVLLVTDGLDRADATMLGEEMKRLHKSCRRLVWLNPLLRYDAFEPKAEGVRAMLPHVDAFLPVHNLASLEQLAMSLGSHGILTARRPEGQAGRAFSSIMSGTPRPARFSSQVT
jgi:uncharacterized protein